MTSNMYEIGKCHDYTVDIFHHILVKAMFYIGGA